MKPLSTARSSDHFPTRSHPQPIKSPKDLFLFWFLKSKPQKVITNVNQFVWESSVIAEVRMSAFHVRNPVARSGSLGGIWSRHGTFHEINKKKTQRVKAK
jgi:hypothetical protein